MNATRSAGRRRLRSLGLIAAALAVVLTAIVPLAQTPARADATSTSVPVTDSNVYWSPYNWKAIGTTGMQTTPAGGYLKVAFDGTALGLGVDTSFMTGVTLTGVILHAYVDGSTTPITKTLADAVDGKLSFTSTLGAGSHYAVVYLAQSTGADRWTVPRNALRVTSIELDGSGATSPLSGTPIAVAGKRILLYGDSITEGAATTGAENAYSAVLAHRLGVEYGQLGYGSSGWLAVAQGTNQSFYSGSSTGASLWRNYDSTTTRLAGPALSDGYIGGEPDLVLVALGINDANGNKGAGNVQGRVGGWLNEIRQTAPSSWVCFLQPFNFGNASNTTYPAYKQAINTAVSDYLTAHPAENKLCTVDLGTEGYDVVFANSSDKLHPNNTGASILGKKVAAAIAPNLGITLPVETPPTQTATPGQVYGLQSAMSGKFADVSSAQSASSAVVQNTGTAASNQRWLLTSTAGGAYTLTNRANGKCLDVKGASTAPGASVIFWNCSGAVNQRWQPTPTSDGSGYTLVSATSGQCLDVKNASTDDGVVLVQNPCATGSSQIWKLVDAQPATARSYTMQAAHSGKNADLSTVPATATVAVVQRTPAATTNQRWTPTSVGDHIVTLTNAGSGQCLDVAASSTPSGASIVSSACSGSGSQKWRLRPNTAGTSYQLQSVASGLCADVSAASTAESAVLIQYACGAGQNQQWRFLS